MALINLAAGGYSVIPEGTHVLKITKVEYKEEFGKLLITMETRTGQKHTERFTLVNSEGDVNQGALNAFSYFAKVAMNDFSLTSIDHTDLIGKFVECDITHEEVDSNREPGKKVIFTRLTDKRPSVGWADTPAQASVPVNPKGKVDLAALLG